MLTLFALCAMFLIALYTAFGFATSFMAMSSLLAAGLAASLLPYRYYGWPYAEKGSYRDIESAALYDMMESMKEFRVIDVRSRAEYARGHIPGAVNMPLTRIPGDTLFPGPTVFVCSTGHRSRIALRKIRGKDLYNLSHGYRKWIEAALPVETGKGDVPDKGKSQLP